MRSTHGLFGDVNQSMRINDAHLAVLKSTLYKICRLDLFTCTWLIFRKRKIQNRMIGVWWKNWFIKVRCYTHLWMQCAAVITHSGEIREPPHKYAPCNSLSITLTCQGHSPSNESVPPTIRLDTNGEPHTESAAPKALPAATSKKNVIWIYLSSIIK